MQGAILQRSEKKMKALKKRQRQGAEESAFAIVVAYPPEYLHCDRTM